MERMRMLGGLVAMSLAASMVLAGCSPAQEDPAAETDSVEVETPEEATPTVEATETPQGTVLDIVVAEEDLQTFDRAAREAGLYQAMQGLGPYTILAPSDEAFDQMGADAINELLEPENRDVLARLITFHVIPGRWTLEDLRAAESVPTLSGRFIEVTPMEDGVILGGVRLGEPVQDVEEGIVYRIDQVLDPFSGRVAPQRSQETTP